MKTLLLACIVSCRMEGRDGPDVESCWYDMRSDCGRAAVCVASKTRECHPRYVDLGEWNPVKNQYELKRGGQEVWPSN